MDHSRRGAPVTLTLDGIANDGEAGEGDDDVHLGGDGDDTFVADWRDDSDVFDGGAGTADVVTYAVRADPVIADLDGVADDGAAGERDNVRSNIERLIGGASADRLTGNGAVNVLRGGGGGDVLTGSSANDRLYGDAGDDWLVGGLGADWLNGGVDFDDCTGDALDTRQLCEVATIPPPPGEGYEP